MSTRNKVLLAIALAVLCSWLFGCAESPTLEHYVAVPQTSTIDGDTDVGYLQRLYATYNDAYFQNKLTKTPKIDMLEEHFMASTMCKAGQCTLHFNERYVLAPRAANITMLHEMCHVKTWGTDVVTFGGVLEQADHGKVWRACMLQLDMEGAFREIIIDHYADQMP